ncbi:MAG: aminotransferase class III-fold pyridoxal phosphate-dependent enzyme [Acetobacterales bacterium]
MNDTSRTGGSKELRRIARRVLPAGGFGNVADDIVIARGEGGRVWDADGNRYIDYLLGSGPMLVGHAHPDVRAAIEAQLAMGTTFFTDSGPGILLAEAIAGAVPCADQVRFVSSGSEADAYAMRLARAFRRRDKILKFEGGYHGMSDWGLMSIWPKQQGNAVTALPDSAGIPAVLRDCMLVAPFNDLDAVERLVREHHDDLAGVMVEPFQRVIPPVPGFLEGLRELTARYEIPLIFDEVVTGFRFAYGGAQAYYGVTPDICTLGKVIGGGLPLAAIAGRADIMAHFDKQAVGEAGFVPQVGTLSGNPMAAAAGLATLEVLRRPGTYDALFATGRRLMEGLAGALANAGVPAVVTGVPPMFDVVFADVAIRNYRDTLAGDAERTAAFNAALRKAGILKNKGKFYVSTAHDEDDVRQTLAVFREAAAALT